MLSEQMSSRRKWLQNRLTRYRGFLRTGIAMTVAQGINILTGIGLAVLLARGLGSDGYGLYVFALTLVQMLSIPINMGLPTLLTRQIAIYRSHHDWKSLKGIVRWALGFVALTVVVIVVLAIGYYWLGHKNLERVVGQGNAVSLYGLSIFLIGALGLLRIVSSVLVGFERVIFGTLPDILIRPVVLLTTVFVIQFIVELSPALVMGLHVLAALVALIWATVIMTYRARPEDIRSYKKHTPQFHTKVWLKSLLPLSIIGSASILNSKIDIAMLGMIAGPQDVAIYNVAMQVAGMLLFAQAIMGAIVAPKIARFHAEGDYTKIREVAVIACRLSFLAALICMAIIGLYGDGLIQFVFGAEYSASYGVALIICVGFAFNVSVGLVALILNMTGNEVATARATVFSAVLNAFMNAALIPHYGASGAAAATSITVIIFQLILWNDVRKKAGIRTDILAWTWRSRQNAPSTLGL